MKISRVLFLVALGLFFSPTTSEANTYSFVNFSLADGSSEDASGQMFVDVLQDGSSVDFIIRNSNTGSYIDAIITQIYFDSTVGLLSAFSISGSPKTSAGVSFSPSASPPDLPQGTNISFVADYSAGRDNPGVDNGVNPGEQLGIRFTAVFNDVIAALGSGGLRLGLHVQSIGRAGDSDAYVNRGSDDQPVPEPTSLALLGVAGALAGIRRFKRA